MVFSEETIGKFLENQANRIGDTDYIIYPDRNLRLTYNDVNEKSDLIAKGLVSIGIEKGDNVGIWAKNIPEWIIYFMACVKIGAVVVTINIAYTKKELEYMVKNSDMKALIMDRGFKHNSYIKSINALIPELKHQKTGNLNLAIEDYPYLKNIIYMGEEKHRGMCNTYELISNGENITNENLEKIKSSIKNTDLVSIQYTSGTTGSPKGVMLTHRNILNNGYELGHRIKFKENEKMCFPLPLFHSFGLTLGMLSTLSCGSSIVMIETFDPLLVLSAISKEKCKYLAGVPTMYIAIMNHPMFDLYDMSSLEVTLMGGSSVTPETLKQMIDKFQIKAMVSGYGLTEASPGLISTLEGDSFEKLVSTIGTSFKAIEVKVADLNTNEPLTPGEVGELCCRGYNVMKGYYKMPDKTDEVIDKDGWLHTGDLVTVDENGYYSIVGRIKDIIIRGGENIYPSEIEALIEGLEGVINAQIIGVPDKLYGEIPVAFIIKQDDSDLEEEDVRDFVDDNLAQYKVPKHVFFVDEFPINSSGKIIKSQLSKDAEKLIAKKKKQRLI
ncbi:MAG: AMP-binding protein [Methanobrevibacter sp.]|nr:AMP-binding protein [Candidatus Methanoflexus mossambicus]